MIVGEVMFTCKTRNLLIYVLPDGQVLRGNNMPPFFTPYGGLKMDKLTTTGFLASK